VGVTVLPGIIDICAWFTIQAIKHSPRSGYWFVLLFYALDFIGFSIHPVSSAGSDMTDGAGYINKLPLLQMQSKFEWDAFPTAVQCRLAGSKVRSSRN
jgi:hypothetical protein